MTTQAQPTCKQRIREHYRSRVSDLRRLIAADQAGQEDGVEDLGTLNEYGLSFDYVAPGTFSDQRRGYWRYQLSWGGPGDEFRFYCDENRQPVRIEYWFLDWFDGARITLRSGRDFSMLRDWLANMDDCGMLESTRREALEGR